MKKKVLITGAAGRIGGIVRRFLASKYELSALDIAAVEDIPSRVADLADLDAIMPAFEGQDTVVHLGADPSGGAPWESVLPNNIVGMYNVMEACRAAGVKRVVFASTNHVVGYYPEKEDPYKAVFEGRLDDAQRPFPLLTAEHRFGPIAFTASARPSARLLGASTATSTASPSLLSASAGSIWTSVGR